MQQEAFFLSQERPGLEWLRNTWSIPREEPLAAKGDLGGGLMKARIQVVASAFSTFPEAHFPPWLGAWGLHPQRLCQVPPCTFARSQETCIQISPGIYDTMGIQVLDLTHFHCVTFRNSLFSLQASVSSCIKYRDEYSRCYLYQSRQIYWIHCVFLLF